MYLEVTLPVIRPSLMVISDHGRDTIDFGDIVNGNLYSLNSYIITGENVRRVSD